MDTYNGPLNRRINHFMMLIHSYLSLAFVLPAVTGKRFCGCGFPGLDKHLVVHSFSREKCKAEVQLIIRDDKALKISMSPLL